MIAFFVICVALTLVMALVIIVVMVCVMGFDSAVGDELCVDFGLGFCFGNNIGNGFVICAVINLRIMVVV